MELKHYYEKSEPFTDVVAIQLTSQNAAQVAEWCGGLEVEEIDPFDSSKRYAGVNVPTPAGRIRASEGDFVLKSVVDEFYVSRPVIFLSDYEEM